jgi:L-iditol 2-dehydrogenase
MAIAELTARRTFSVRDYEPEPPGPGQVQVRINSVGVCGSDLHNFSEGHVGGSYCVYPQVLGHEPTGTVTAAGEGVTGWAPGDLAALEAAHYCYHCQYCMSGRHNLCETVRFHSNPGVPGFFRDHICLPAVNLLPLPAGLSLDEAALFEPIAIILHSFRFGDPRLGETAAVLGAGPIGLTTIAALRVAGVSRIWATDPVPHRRELALALGADVAIDPAQVDPVKQVMADTGNRGVDVAFDCAAMGDTVNQAIGMGAPGARIVITGLPAEARTPINFHLLRVREQHFFPVRRSNHKSEQALRLLAAEKRRFTPMITHTVPLDQVQRAFETLEAYADGVGKVVIHP